MLDRMAIIRSDVTGCLRSLTRRSFLLGTLLVLFFLLVTTFLNNIQRLGCGAFVGMFSSDALMPARQRVLLVTYGRSGSTFTSALISHHRDVFFIFEPLYPLKLSLINSDRQNDSTSIIQSFMECELPAEHAFALDNRQFIYREDTRNVYDCLLSPMSGFAHVACYMTFLEDCRRHDTILIKTIRFRVKWAETFLQDNPHFKLLYLVRDPRATLFSQARMIGSFLWPNEVVDASKHHCMLLNDDLEDVVNLAKLYPGRVKGIRYENGATDPISYTKDIYNFLGLEYSIDVDLFIENITTASADAPDVEAAFGVIRQNSTQTMNNWRQQSDFKSIRLIDTICGFMYSKLGYKFVESPADLRSHRPLVDSPNLNIF